MNPRRSVRPSVAAFVLVWSCVTSDALALTPEEEATAIRLMREGIAARDQGDLATAQRSFEAAHAIADLPSSGIALAKVLSQRGQLLRALQVVNGVLRLERSERWSIASVEGYQEAIALRPELESRIPSLVVEVDGATDASVSVSVDGSRLRPPVLGVPRQMDPGAHRVVVEQDGREPFSVDIQLDEREREVLRPTLRERRRHGALVDPAGPVGASPGPSTPTPSRDGGRPLLVTGIVVGGVGVLGLSAGILTGVLAKSKESDLEPSCPGGVCAPALADELHTAESYALAANVLYVAGGVLSAAGLTMIAIDLGTSDDHGSTSAQLRFGPGFVGIDGRF